MKSNLPICYVEDIANHNLESIIDLIEVGDYVNGVRVEMIENGITEFG